MPILLNDPDGCPFVARSAGKTCMVVPSADPDWTEQKRHAAVMHECAHAARHDSDMMFIIELIFCVAWHIPFVRTLVETLERDREEACDEIALKNGVNPLELASLLLELSTPYRHASVPGAQGVQGNNTIERRIIMIMKRQERNARTSRHTLIKVSFFLAVTAISLYALPQLFAEQKPGLPEEGAVERITIQARDPSKPMDTHPIQLPLDTVPVALPVEGTAWHMTLGFGKHIHSSIHTERFFSFRDRYF